MIEYDDIDMILLDKLMMYKDDYKKIMNYIKSYEIIDIDMDKGEVTLKKNEKIIKKKYRFVGKYSIDDEKFEIGGLLASKIKNMEYYDKSMTGYFGSMKTIDKLLNKNNNYINKSYHSVIPILILLLFGGVIFHMVTKDPLEINYILVDIDSGFDIKYHPEMFQEYKNKVKNLGRIKREKKGNT